MLETGPALTLVASKEPAATAASQPNPPRRIPEIERRHRHADGLRTELGRLPRGILEIERRHRPRAFRWLRRLLVVGAAVLVVLFVWNFLTAPGVTRAPEPAGSRAQPAFER